MKVNFNVLNQLATPAMYAAALALRPVPGFAGRVFIDTDAPSTGIYRDTGTAWVQVAGSGGGGGGTLQTVTDAGNTTTNNMVFNDPTAAAAQGLNYQKNGVEKWALRQYNNGAGLAYFGIYDADKSYNVMTFLTNARVGVFRDDPAYSFDLSGDFRNTSNAYFATGGLSSVGINTTSVNGSALLQMDSTTKGFLPPRMTTTQRNAIATPAAGLSLYNSSLGTIDFYNGTAWKSGLVGSSSSTRVAVFDAANSLTGYGYFTVADALYPTITIGVNGTNPVGLRFKTAAASDYSYIDPTTGLTFRGSTTYPFIDFYDKIGGTQMLRLYDSGGFVAQFAGRINTVTTSTAGTNLGAFNIDRTFSELVTGPNQHGYVDKSVFRYGAGAINSFYSELTIGTTNAAYTQDHCACFQSRVTKDGANVLSKVYDFVALGTLANGGTITDRYALYVYNANTAGGGAITNQYGVYVPALSGAVKNVGIYSGSPVSIGTDTPNAAALLQIDSTTQGVLFPRMTTAQKAAITTPPAGLCVYDTTLSKLCIYTGAAWETITSV